MTEVIGGTAEAYWGTERPSGTYVTLRYEVTYAKYTAIETLTVFKPHNAADDELKTWGRTSTQAGYCGDESRKQNTQ